MCTARPALAPQPRSRPICLRARWHILGRVSYEVDLAALQPFVSSGVLYGPAFASLKDAIPRSVFIAEGSPAAVLRPSRLSPLSHPDSTGGKT
jgi:hypothetical protein